MLSVTSCLSLSSPPFPPTQLLHHGCDFGKQETKLSEGKTFT